MAGLPGAGLCGFFYILLILSLALREGFLVVTRPWTANGSTCGLEAARLAAIACAIVIAMWGEGWVLQSFAKRVFGVDLSALTPTFAISNFVVLAIVIASVHVLRIFFPRKAVMPSSTFTHELVNQGDTTPAMLGLDEFETPDMVCATQTDA